MADLPIAMMLYKRTSSGNEMVQYTGWCPTHGFRSSKPKPSTKFLAPQGGIDGKTYWTFLCKENGGHSFVNQPDPQAPDQEGLEAWKEVHRIRWVTEKKGTGQ